MSWVTSRQMSQSESVLKPAAMISDSFGTWAMTTFLRSAKSPPDIRGGQPRPV